MRIEQRRVGTVDVLSPIGALVDADAENFVKKLRQRISSGNSRIVVSLQDVQFVDSAALEGLLSAADDLESQAARLKFSNVNPMCREIFELTGLASRFGFFADIQDAVRSFI